MDTEPQLSVAVVWVPIVAPSAGALFTAQTGTGITTAAVVNVVVLAAAQVVAAPVAFLGDIPVVQGRCCQTGCTIAGSSNIGCR